MTINMNALNAMRDTEEFRVNTHRLAQFAEALGDGNEAHATGARAVPIFAHVPVMQSMVEVVSEATQVFTLHGEHDFHFHKAIVPGMRLFSRSSLIGVRATPAGAAVVVRSDSETHDGTAVCTQYTTCLMPEATADRDVGERAPAPTDLAGAETATQAEYLHALDDALTFRYADAARDYSAYTLDPEAAAAVGYPAPIVHGMCAMGFACRAVVEEACRGDSTRLARLGGRFSAPLFLKKGQTLTTLVRFVERDDFRAVCFMTSDMDGSKIIKNGFAEVRP